MRKCEIVKKIEIRIYVMIKKKPDRLGAKKRPYWYLSFVLERKSIKKLSVSA